MSETGRNTKCSSKITLAETTRSLAEYQRKKTIDALLGPFSSIFLHILVLVSIIVFYNPEPNKASRSIEIENTVLEIKELDKAVQEEMQKLEEIAQDMVPTVEKPTVPIDSSLDLSSISDFTEGIASTDDGMEFNDVLDIRPSNSSLKISSLYGGRTNAGRMKTLKKYGGSDVTEAAVLKALRWLKSTQNEDGSWPNVDTKGKARKEEIAMTGLALLTFLAHGEIPSEDNPEFGPAVQKGIQFLSEKINSLDKPPPDYRNGIAAYALSEAYGMTHIPFIKPPMEKSLTWIVEGQQSNGGFDYFYKKDERWDLSVACWQFQALKAGYVAGADVNGLKKAIDRGISFMKNVAFSKENNRFGYTSPGKGTDGLQGAAVLCLQLLGDGDCDECKKVAAYISKNCKVIYNDTTRRRKVSTATDNEIYAWYYQTQAMFHTGSSAWKQWNTMFVPELVKHQNREGYWECPNKDPVKYQVKYDKWYTTTLAALSLQVYYRYLPTFKMSKNLENEEKTTMQKLDEELFKNP